jgi:hypothetical protein
MAGSGASHSLLLLSLFVLTEGVLVASAAPAPAKVVLPWLSFEARYVYRSALLAC